LAMSYDTCALLLQAIAFPACDWYVWIDDGLGQVEQSRAGRQWRW
jgi:hypothetical protein